jgi:predicted secreted protein with PEFG-CTERM motif
MANRQYVAYALTAVLAVSIISIAPGIAYSQQVSRMIVSVDKTSYGVGETVMVSGKVPTVLEGETVAIQVFNPRGVMYTIAQLIPEADRTFSTSVNIGGKLGIAGTYTVKATYLGQTTQTTFDFTGGPGGLTVSGIRIDASLSNGSISRIQVDEDFNSLIITVRTGDNDGTLTITLPREVIDAKLNGADDEFIVLVDGEEAEYEETDTTATSRTLSIAVPAGSSEIEIIGTFVIPEFGIIAALVLAVAVGAIIIISRKNQILNILPR